MIQMKIAVVDPGHGKRDPGAVANNREEATCNLQVASLLRDALQRSNWKVIMTRTTDQLPLGANADIGADLSYRAKIANDANADVFVSWHADSSSDPSVNGVATWVHPNAPAATVSIAQRIVDAIAASTGQKDTGVHRGDFAVLRETNMNAVLVEGDFITNPDSAKKLFDPEFQRKQAEAAAKALCEAYGVTYVAPVVPTPPKPNAIPFSGTSGEECEAWLGNYYQIADADRKKAAHWLADQYRVIRGAITIDAACKDTSFTDDAASAVILSLQAKYQADTNADHHAAAKWGADLLRKLKNIA
jgi:N-acetylmuramoyl-L-alanine amidase